MNLSEMFSKYEDDFLKFDLVENKLSKRPDLHAFLLLDSLMPQDRDMVSSSEHDQIWLDIDCEKLAEIITEDQIKELSACGVLYDDVMESLFMFA